jgi:streptogramin lyase
MDETKRHSKFEVFEPHTIPRPNIYDVISDVQNDVYFTVSTSQFSDGRTLEGSTRKPARSRYIRRRAVARAPRRGTMDRMGRLWFGENRANRIGMFDTRTERFQEWAAPTPESWPYDATPDHNGEVWSGGEFSDRVLRLDPTTGGITEYLLPQFTKFGVSLLTTRRRLSPSGWETTTARPLSSWNRVTHAIRCLVTPLTSRPPAGRNFRNGRCRENRHEAHGPKRSPRAASSLNKRKQLGDVPNFPDLAGYRSRWLKLDQPASDSRR